MFFRLASNLNNVLSSKTVAAELVGSNRIMIAEVLSDILQSRTKHTQTRKLASCDTINRLVEHCINHMILLKRKE